MIRNLSARTGTTVNDEPLGEGAPRELNDGDALSFGGSVKARVKIDQWSAVSVDDDEE